MLKNDFNILQEELTLKRFLVFAFGFVVLLFSTNSLACKNVCSEESCTGSKYYGGSCYAGYGGPAYKGYGGEAYDGYGGPCYSGYGGACYKGYGGQCYNGYGGPAYAGYGGPAYDGYGGPCYTGYGGNCAPNSDKCPDVCACKYIKD